MPFTPFHFGPGAALAAVAPRHVGLVTFCATNVVIDAESLINLIYGRYPVHTFAHTFVGATLTAAATVAMLLCVRAVARRWPGRLRMLDPTLRQVIGGALVGAWSHVVLDGIMHADTAPWAPFTRANPLFGLVPVDALHASCAVAGVFAIVVLLWREAQHEPDASEHRHS